MKPLKSKSLVNHKTDKDIETMAAYTARFISFEAAIQLFRQEYNLMDLKNKPIGYRITNQGIEIIQE